MAFNTEVPTSYEAVEFGVRFSGRLPKSALEQYDIYAALLAYWDSKTPATWAVVKSYVFANSKFVEDSSDIELRADELNFQQVKFAIEKWLNMASEFFTSPQKKK